ncbi:MlaD family protein [Conexibacter sp. DBS9H8]|uniref:MlaD family protein n=1 Tax=Conexibacter sp. DBS9H8 TaxID=2937801 RepID=UPI00200D785D|nr:MlaD family protein [Conexibacter sp. DBS9H8]
MRGRRLAAILALAAAIVVVVVLFATQSGPAAPTHTLYANFESATNLVSGANVTAGGQTVGHVGTVKLAHNLASVQLDITDNSVWPLPKGTNAEIRWGGTISYSNRYVELLPGPRGDPALANGAQLPTQNTITPVEFDQLFNIFTAPARRSLGAFVDTGASTYGGEAGNLHRGIDASPPAITSVSNVLQQLGEDPAALETLISAGATTAGALQAQQPQLVHLVAGAANTFATIAANARATQATLSRLAPALNGARTALDRLNPALTTLNTVVNVVRPGAIALQALAGPLHGALTKLTTVAPELDRTLATVQTGAPRITGLLNASRPVLVSSSSALATFEPMAACLLPYGPEISGFIENWDSFLSGYDSAGHYARTLVQSFPATSPSTETPAQLVAGNPGLGYALIRPPGFNAGLNQAWFRPQCGDNVQGITAADDPEAP